MMVAFLVGGILAAIFVQRFGTPKNNGMVTAAEADRMVEEAQRQAEVDIRRQMDEEDASAVPEAAPEEPKEEIVEEPAEEPAEEPEEPDHTYYTYTVIMSPLHYRSGPTKDDRAYGYVPVGTTGYVIDYHEEAFSLCVVRDMVAYMHSHYLEVEEVAKEDVPAEYRNITADDVDKKIEELNGEASPAAETAADDGTADDAAAATDSTSSDAQQTTTVDEMTVEPNTSGVTASENSAQQEQLQALEKKFNDGELTEEEFKEQVMQLQEQ